ncbi:MarR family transcriptional regulator [uncultured Roseobacter sp.]|uniref:MarR family winged helix-turn-helix transcriptional regulator n=1 Tax=uncultured Roseobacter sp. TaxID=114847 RepID=UPI0026396F55|nr:MarR family transcriptional regulator [uncultured Roseobacter sp.]
MPDGNHSPSPLLRDQLCFALYATSRAFTKVYADLLKDIGITYPQYLVLLVLWEQGPLTVQSVARELEIESPTATPLIKRMEAMGLVKRTRCIDDERRVLVSLTDKANSYRDIAARIPERLGCAVKVTDAQAGQLLTELTKIRDGIG